MDVVADIFASYAAPTFWVRRIQEDWAIFNPNIFFEASGIGSVTIKLFYIQMTLSLKILGIRYTPLDLQISWDLDKKSRYCYSIGYLKEVFDFTIEAETYVNECYIGLLGALLSDQEATACEWRRYKPQLPLRQLTLFDSRDTAADYVSWSCNDYAELETYDSNSGINADNPAGF